MQYYDVPSRYEIPSNAESITSEKAGEVYYSKPNRIVLFFGDANVSGEYTKVGYFDFNYELKSRSIIIPWSRAGATSWYSFDRGIDLYER